MKHRTCHTCEEPTRRWWTPVAIPICYRHAGVNTGREDS